MKLCNYVKVLSLLCCLALTACGGADSFPGSQSSSAGSSSSFSAEGGISGTGRGNGFKLFGDTQKGPFVPGSMVKAQYLNSDTRQPIGRAQYVQVGAMHGAYTMVLPKEGLVELSVEGQYLNEIHGGPSHHKLTLKSLVYVAEPLQQENINVLTHLINKRIAYLLDERVDDGSVENAKNLNEIYHVSKVQAEQELVESLNHVISVRGIDSFEKLNLYNKDDADNRKGNAYLLAATSILYQYMLNKIPDDITNPGALIDRVLSAATEDFRPDGDFDIEDFIESLEEAVEEINAQRIIDNLLAAGDGELVADLNAILDSDLDGVVNNHDPDDDNDGTPDVVDEAPYDNSNHQASNVRLLSFYQNLNLAEGFGEYLIPNVQPYLLGHAIEFSVTVSDENIIKVFVDESTGFITLQSIPDVCGEVEVTITASLAGLTLSKTFAVVVECLGCSYHSVGFAEIDFDNEELIGKAVDVDGDGTNDYVTKYSAVSGEDGSILFNSDEGDIAAYLGDVNDDEFGDFLITVKTSGNQYERKVISGSDGELLYVFLNDKYYATPFVLDIDGDGEVEIVFRGKGDTQVSSWFGRSGSPATDKLVRIYNVDGSDFLYIDHAGYDVITLTSVGDVDGDRFDDFFINVIGYTTKSHVFSGKTGKAINVFYTFDVKETGFVLPVGDVNADGYDDLVLGKSTASIFGGYIIHNEVRVISSKTQEKIYSLGRAYDVEVIGDVNGDGVGDLFVVSPLSSHSAWVDGVEFRLISAADGRVLFKENVNNGFGIFSPYFGFGETVYATNIGDVDKDGMPDVRVSLMVEEDDVVVKTYGVSKVCQYERDLSLEYEFFDYVMYFFGGIISRVEVSIDGVVEVVKNSIDSISVTSIMHMFGDVGLAVFVDDESGESRRVNIAVSVAVLPEISEIPDYQLSENFNRFSIPLIIKADPGEGLSVSVIHSNESLLSASYNVESKALELLSGVDACGESTVQVTAEYKGVTSTIRFLVKVSCDYVCVNKDSYIKPLWELKGTYKAHGYKYNGWLKNVGDINQDGVDEIGVLVTEPTDMAYVSIVSGGTGVELQRIDVSTSLDGRYGGSRIRPELITSDVNDDGLLEVGVFYEAWTNSEYQVRRLVNFYSIKSGEVASSIPSDVLYSGVEGSTTYYENMHSPLINMGDLNADSVDDFLIPLSLYEYESGAPVRVISGRDYTDMFTINLQSSSNEVKVLFDLAGDVNGDGVNDIIVGLHRYDEPGGVLDVGAAYLYSGVDGSLISDFYGRIEGDYFGTSIGAAGDVDNDGFDDFIIGGASRVNVYSGKTLEILRVINFHETDLLSAYGWKNYDYFVGSAGDVNGDTYNDFYISRAKGINYIYSGKDGDVLYFFDDNIVGDMSFEEDVGYGELLVPLGDINHDGYADLMLRGLNDFIEHERYGDDYTVWSLHALISQHNTCPVQKVINIPVNQKSVYIEMLDDWQLSGMPLSSENLSWRNEADVSIKNYHAAVVKLDTYQRYYNQPSHHYFSFNMLTDDGDHWSKFNYVVLNSEQYIPVLPDLRSEDVYLIFTQPDKRIAISEHDDTYVDFEIYSNNPALEVEIEKDGSRSYMHFIAAPGEELHATVTITAELYGEQASSSFDVYVDSDVLDKPFDALLPKGSVIMNKYNGKAVLPLYSEHAGFIDYSIEFLDGTSPFSVFDVYVDSSVDGDFLYIDLPTDVEENLKIEITARFNDEVDKSILYVEMNGVYIEGVSNEYPHKVSVGDLSVQELWGIDLPQLYPLQTIAPSIEYEGGSDIIYDIASSDPDIIASVSAGGVIRVEHKDLAAIERGDVELEEDVVATITYTVTAGDDVVTQDMDVWTSAELIDYQ